MSDISVIGLGYVGLPAAVMFASSGHRVHGFDINKGLVDDVMNGEAGADENHLNDLLQKALATGRIDAASSLSAADVFVIAVPTPIKEDRTPDLSYVIEACRSVAGKLASGNLVVIESTIPPGSTGNEITNTLEESGLEAGRDFSLAYCPERVLPGNIVSEIVKNDRIIGGIDHVSTERATELYRSFVTGDLRQSDASTAEMVKLAENTYRDVNIALVNSLANLSTSVGVNVWDVVELANHHPRVDILQPGPGVGGHCIPVDPWFLVAADDDNNSGLIRMSRDVNDGQPTVIARLAAGAVTEKSNARAALLGAAYKPNVWDARESPTTDLVARLADHGVTGTVTDPHVVEFEPDIVPLDEALAGADIAILVVGHREYLELIPQDIASMMRNPVILDTTNSLDRNAWESAGFTFLRYGDGRTTP